MRQFAAARSVQSQRLYATAPNVDEIQFQIVGDTTTELSTRPFPTRSRRELEEGIKQKANQTRSVWEAKFSSETPEGALFKDLLKLTPVRTPHPPAINFE